MKWNIAICQEIFGPIPFDACCAKAAALGYDGIEIAPFIFSPDIRSFSPRVVDAARDMAARHGLELPAMHWLLASPPGMSITSPDPAIRKNTLDFAGYLVEFAHRLGVKVLVFGSPAQRDIDPSWQHSGAFKRGVDFLAGMARACEERGLVIGFEPLGPSITNFGATVEDAIEIVEIVGSPALQLHLDVKALLLEKIPPAELIMLANRRIVHFHANDANRLGPGMGAVDHVPILKALASVGYSGWLSVETFGNAVPPDEIAARSITYLRHVMAGIA